MPPKLLLSLDEVHRNSRESATDRKDYDSTLELDRLGISSISSVKLDKINKKQRSFGSVGDDLANLNNLLGNKSSSDID